MKAFEYENQGSGSYLVYKIGADEEINTFVLGMISNNNLEGILKMSKLQLDGEVQIRYLISAKRQLVEYLKNERLTRDAVLDMLYRILQTIINASEYMIRQNEFILDVQYIYVDISTKKPCLMLAPVKNRGLINESIDIFVKNFIYSIGYTDEILINTVNKIMGMLNKCNSIADFRDAIRLDMANKSIAQPSIAAVNQQPVVQPLGINNRMPSVQNVNMQKPLQGSSQGPAQTPAQQAPMQSKVEIPKVVNAKNSEPKVNIPFAVPGMPNGINIPEQQNKEEAKEKKGLFGLKFGKEKRVEEEPKPIAPINVPMQPNNVNVVPVVPNNVQVPKQPTIMQSYGSTNDSNTVLIGGYNQSSDPYLYRTKSGENIQITKDYFKIGKSSTQVDFQILNNNAISNFHAAVIRRGSEYYICDPGSTNHTFVDGVKLEVGQEVKINHDSHIRMANEEFVFKMIMG